MKKVIDWIKKNYILVLFGILLIVIAILWLNNKSLNKKIDIQSVELMVQNDSTKIYKTKAGDYYSKFQAEGIKKNSLKKSLDIMGITNKELRDRNIKQGDIISALEFKVKAMGDIIANVKDSIIHDTIPGKPDITIPTVKWDDTHLYLNGYIQDKIFKGKYTYNLSLLNFVEQKGKSYIVTIYPPDNNKGVTITNGSQIIVTPTKHWWEKPWIWGLAGVGAGIFITR